MVYIEDDSDQVFWETFIDNHFPNKYNITASIRNHQGERGKRALEKLFYKDANEKAIIAVDTDYDLLCPCANPQYSSYLINNKFILHTFGFSRESALLNKKHLNSFFKTIKYTIQHNIDIDSFISKLSALTFKGLTFFTHELNTGNKFGLIARDFHNCFHILGEKIVKDDLSLDENLLSIIENNLCSYFHQLQYTDEQIALAENYLQTLDINCDNAYRYISGHTVYNLIYKIHEQLTALLYQYEVDNIKNTFSGAAVSERIRQLRSTFPKQFPLEAFCHNYPINHNDEIHQKIKDKIAAII
nr:DUF4435 domain-containing protein [Acinetobacter modestus]